MLVFSLPFCLLLPDDVYQVKLAVDDVITLKLAKKVPTIFDERLPIRGFLKGELENIKRLKIYNPKTGPGGWIDKDQLNRITGMQIVLEYETLDGKKIPPQYVEANIEQDVNWDDDLQQIALENTNRDIDFGHETYTLSDDDILKPFYEGRKLVLNCELKQDRNGRFRYTRVIYESSKKLSSELEFERAVRALNTLISSYRLYTRSHWITRVSEREFYFYKTFTKNDSNHGSLEKGYHQIYPDFPDSTVNMIKDSLMDIETQNLLSRMPFFQLRLDAQNAFDQTDYHLSIIYIITALESIVKVLLSFYYDKQKMKRTERTPISILVTKHLKELFPFFQLAIYLDDIRFALDTRNRIIHEADINIHKDEARKILRDVSDFMNFLLRNLELKMGRSQ